MNTERLLRFLSAMHWLGLAMLIFGIYSLWTNNAPETRSMMLYATLIGLGLLMMGSYPILLFIRWSQKSSSNKPE